MALVSFIALVNCTNGTGTPLPPTNNPQQPLPTQPALGACGGSQQRCGSDCVTFATDPFHCGSCTNICSVGQTCVSGQCTTACPAGQMACQTGGLQQCSSLQSDPNNCGSCGQRCQPGQSCLNGSCQMTNMANPCPGLTACPVGTTGGGQQVFSCVQNLQTDPANCGTCGNRCPTGQACLNGQCQLQCQGGLMACGNQCVNTQNSQQHCGTCFQTCGLTQICNGGRCQNSCGQGQTDCFGICAFTQTDPNNCGACGNRCQGGQLCINGQCLANNSGMNACPAGQTQCGFECANLQRDYFHCGTCQTTCTDPISGGFGVCLNGVCQGLGTGTGNNQCQAGQQFCRDRCTFTQSDPNNCGRCGNICQFNQFCQNGQCVSSNNNGGATISGPTFRINQNGLTSSNCRVINHENLTGDDRGGIAVDRSYVLISGDRGTARYNRSDLRSGRTLPSKNQAIVSNLQNGQLYALSDNVGPLNKNGGTITRLLPLDGMTGEIQLTGAINLSMPIQVPGGNNSNVGIFAGWNRIVILTPSQNGRHQVWQITLSNFAGGGTAQVQSLSTINSPPRQACEQTWAYWGIVEGQNQAQNLLLVRDRRSIVRVNLQNGQVNNAFQFNDLDDACSFSVWQNQWFFMHEVRDGRSQFVQNNGDYVVRCPAQVQNGQVQQLNSNNCRTQNVGNTVGDDEGGVAVSTTHVLFTGQNATGIMQQSNLSNPQAVRLLHDGMISNLRTGQVFVIGSNGRPIAAGGGIVTELIELRSGGALSNDVHPLQDANRNPITIDVRGAIGNTEAGFFSGWDRAVIDSNDTVYHFDLRNVSSGDRIVVQNLGRLQPLQHALSDDWAYWGVTEYFNNTLYLTYVRDSRTIVRTSWPGGQTQTVATFTNLGDMASFTIAPNQNRWYWHHENNSQFPNTNNNGEYLGYCRANTSTNSN